MKMTQRLSRGALMVAMAAAPMALRAQTATVSGYLGAFDVVNVGSQPAHGFEIRIEGAQPNDLYYTVFGGRYGTPSIVPYATGVAVRYTSIYNAATGQWSATTGMHAPGAPFGWNDCYQAGANYANSGCEHFGQSLRPTPPGQITAITGRWLVDDAGNPGNLVAVDPPAAIPFAFWSVTPPTSTTPAAPIVVAEVQAPEAPETPEKYGDAQWMKVFVTQLPRELTADELISGNVSVVPSDPTQVETAWELVQASPPTVNGKQNRTRTRNQGGIAVTTRAIVRRFEMYKYTGAYDATTHQAVCADGTCTAPSSGELGDALSAQNTALNVTADSIVVNRTGNGGVAGGAISCGSACAQFATKGTSVTLNESPGGLIFAGWGGVCSGTQTSCVVSPNGQTVVTALFKSQFTLSVGRSNPGTVTGTPTGNDRALDCGGNCSAKFTDGTQVTLSATPPAGKTFVNWSGACSGTAPTCVVTITKDTSVQAVFSK